MATTTTKLKRLNTQRVKQAFLPALAHTGAALAGGLTGSAIGRASGLLGVLALAGGAVSGKEWLTAAGAGMLTAGIAGAASPQLKASPTGKTDLKTEMHNGKERARTYGQLLKEKFLLDKLFKKKTAEPGELGKIDYGAFADLDRLEQSVNAQAFDNLPSLPAAAEALPAPSATATEFVDFSRF